MILILYKGDKIVGAIRGGEVKDDGIWVGHYKVTGKVNASWEYVPEQSLASLYHYDEEGGVTISGVWPDDVVRYTDEEKAQLVDRDTGKAIDEAVHPFAGIEEQIGIIRADLAALHVKVGVAPTDEFAKLNAIAAEKIQEARKKKEMLNYAKDS